MNNLVYEFFTKLAKTNIGVTDPLWNLYQCFHRWEESITEVLQCFISLNQQPGMDWSTIWTLMRITRSWFAATHLQWMVCMWLIILKYTENWQSTDFQCFTNYKPTWFISLISQITSYRSQFHIPSFK